LKNKVHEKYYLQPTKVALYCRTASTNSSDTGAIDIQLDRLRTFSNQHGYKVCAEYKDDGFIGNNLERPAFVQMQSDILSGKIDTVVVHNINRIARDYFLLEKCLRDFKSRGIKIIAADGSHEFISAGNLTIELVRSKTGMIK